MKGRTLTSHTAGFNNWGHMSQVVWPDTQRIGCGIAKCPGGGVNAACMYQPAGRSHRPVSSLVLRCALANLAFFFLSTGNLEGSFDKVKPPTGQPIVIPNGQTHF